jgi:hypothetical protein
MTENRTLRAQLVNLLTVRQAHMDFADVVAGFPMAHINTRPAHCDYTFWHLLEHLRLCQRDILDYIQAHDYRWPNFPDDLWPAQAAVTDATGWQRTVDQFLADRLALVEIINDPSVDLFAPLANSGEYRHSLLREIHIIAAHNAYHTGELGILRQVMRLW